MIIDPKTCSSCGATNEPWLVWDGADNVVIDCCGHTTKLTPSHYLLTFGKYKDKNLGEVDDEWYLSFLKKIAVEKSDALLLKVLELKSKK
jgi:hypothetical protein